MNIFIKKIKERPDAEVPFNITEGNERIVHGILDESFKEPTVGESFVLNGLSRWFVTSVIEEIIDDHTFKTLNSIYEWKKI